MAVFMPERTKEGVLESRRGAEHVLTVMTGCPAHTAEQQGGALGGAAEAAVHQADAEEAEVRGATPARLAGAAPRPAVGPAALSSAGPHCLWPLLGVWCWAPGASAIRAGCWCSIGPTPASFSNALRWVHLIAHRITEALREHVCMRYSVQTKASGYSRYVSGDLQSAAPPCWLWTARMHSRADAWIPDWIGLWSRNHRCFPLLQDAAAAVAVEHGELKEDAAYKRGTEDLALRPDREHVDLKRGPGGLNPPPDQADVAAERGPDDFLPVATGDSSAAPAGVARLRKALSRQESQGRSKGPRVSPEAAEPLK